MKLIVFLWCCATVVFGSHDISGMLKHILGSEAESLDVVQELFVGAETGWRKPYLHYDVVLKAKVPEVLDYLMTQASDQCGAGPYHTLAGALEATLYSFRPLVPGTQEFDLLLVLLKWWRTCSRGASVQSSALSINIEQGRIDVVRACYEAGYRYSDLGRFSSRGLNIIENQAEMIQLLIEHGESLEACGRAIAKMIENQALDVETFAYYLKQGLPVDFMWWDLYMPIAWMINLAPGAPVLYRKGDNYSLNWFEIALKADNIPLAEYAFNLGLRMKPKTFNTWEGLGFKANPIKFAHHLARKEAIAKHLLVLLGAADSKSQFATIPNDLVLSKFPELISDLIAQDAQRKVSTMLEK